MQVGREIGQTVGRVLDRLVAISEPLEGFIPSTIDLASGAMITELPPAIEGQRDGDRALAGSNLIHDQALLRTLDVLGAAHNKPAWRSCVDSYLKRFVRDCTGSASGLFPWGEHLYWDLQTNAVANSYDLMNDGKTRALIHDHLRACPQWLWDRLTALDANCVTRFADGLQYHWTSEQPKTYIRHALYAEQRPMTNGAPRSCDFPRHAGFYIYDIAVAYTIEPTATRLAQIAEFADYWWKLRRDDGLLNIESRNPDPQHHNNSAPGQTLSLATSMLEAADLIEPVDANAAALAGEMRKRAAVYIDGFLSAPHKPDEGVFLIIWQRGDEPIHKAMPAWGSRYGVWPLSYIGMTACQAYHLTGDARLLDYARASGRTLLTTPFSNDKAVPAMDAGLGLELLTELFAITGDDAWLDGAAQKAMEFAGIYIADTGKGDLIRGAAGTDYYESQPGPSFLLHAMARTALMLEHGRDCPLEGDFTAR